MEKELDYKCVPDTYAHCFNTNCPRADECLRQLAARHVTAVRPTLRAVNPAVWADCGLFQPIRLVQEAWGLRNALDRLPHKEAVTVKKRLNHLYTRPTLSRIMNHQRSIPPAEQAALLKLFAAAGVPADQVFDRVQLSYDWTARP